MNILLVKKYYHSNQQQIIEQVKLTYFTLGEAFEKQIKTIEDQGKKQVETLKEQRKAVEEKFDEELSMQKEIYNRLLKERTSEIQKISDEINYDDLICFKGPSTPVNLVGYENPSDIYKIKNGDKTIQAAEGEQKKLKSKLGDITSEKPENKSKYQLDKIKAVRNLYNSRQKIIDLFNANAKNRS